MASPPPLRRVARSPWPPPAAPVNIGHLATPAGDQVVTRAAVSDGAPGAYVGLVPGGSDAQLIVALTPEEAMTVLAALRQYEPYWPSGESAADLAERLANLREAITSVIDKIRTAAAESG